MLLQRRPWLLVSIAVGLLALAGAPSLAADPDIPADSAPSDSNAPAPVENDDPYATYAIRMQRNLPEPKSLSYAIHLTDTKNLSASVDADAIRQSDYFEVQADIVERTVKKDAQNHPVTITALLKSISGRTDSSQDLDTLKVQGALLDIALSPIYEVKRADGKPISAHERAFIDRIFKPEAYHSVQREPSFDPPGEIHVGDTWTPNTAVLAHELSYPRLFTLTPDNLQATFSLDDRSIVDNVDCLDVSADVTEDDVPTHIPGAAGARSSIEVKCKWSLPVDKDQDTVAWSADATVSVSGTAFSKAAGQYDVEGNFEEQVEISDIKSGK